jgi:hypothetical protein
LQKLYKDKHSKTVAPLLHRIPFAEGLPDGSGKHGEGFARWLAPDLQRTAGTEDDGSNTDECAKKYISQNVQKTRKFLF